MKTSKEIREVLDEALSIGKAHNKENARHRTGLNRIMARAATNVYWAHLVGAIENKGFTPLTMGAEALSEVQAKAAEGVSLSAKSYALLIGYSEAYISRLYRLGNALEQGLADPEAPTNGTPSRWSVLSRGLADTPEVGAVLGKDAKDLPTEETLAAAIEKAQERRRQEARKRAAQAANGPDSWIPPRPSERLERLETLAEVIAEGRHLTPKQIDKVREVMDLLRETIEEWVQAKDDPEVAAS